jgi:hypothetical protein
VFIANRAFKSECPECGIEIDQDIQSWNVLLNNNTPFMLVTRIESNEWLRFIGFNADVDLKRKIALPSNEPGTQPRYFFT